MFGNTVIWLLMIVPYEGGHPTTLPPQYETEEACKRAEDHMQEQRYAIRLTSFCYSQTISPFTEGNIILEQ